MMSRWMRRLMIALCLLGGFSFVSVVALTPTAEAKKKKKKKSGSKAKKGAAAAEGDEEGGDEAADKPGDKKADKGAKDKDKDKDGEGEDEAPAAEDPTKRAGAANLKIDTAIDTKEINRTKQADLKRDEAIEELKKLIPKAPAGRKAEMIFRLAELYWEKSKYKYGLEMEVYEKAYNTWSEEGQRGKAPALKDYLRESELIKQNALKLYEKVLAEYPTYERNDEVLFYLGYNEYEAGNKKVAVSHYWTLIKQFPESRLVPDAYLQLGEHFFADNNVINARKAYERALGEAGSKSYNYALYKLAWCDYNIQEYAAGITKLKEVIDRSEKAQDKKSVQLKGEALGDLARFFSYVDEVDTAFDYFKKKGGEEIAIRYSTRLGQLFHDQGKWELEVKTYRMLIDKYPMNDKAPYLQASIVEAYSQMNNKPKVREEVERLVDLYRPGTPWYKVQKDLGDKGKAALEYAYDLTESKLRDLVTEYHQDAQKRKDAPTYELARDIYAKYLEAFSDTDSAYEMRYFYAEVLWALNEWKNAAYQYEQVATAKTDGKALGKYARFAAYNMILAWEKVVAVGEKSEVKGPVKESKDKGDVETREITKLKVAGFEKGKVYKEEALPETELKLSLACDLYFKIADPKDEDLPAIKFKAAYLYFKHYQFVEAAKRYFEMIERWPGDDLSKKAAVLVLDSLSVQEKWDELAFYAEKFQENKKLAANDKKFQEEVQELLEGATYKSIQGAETKARTLADKDAMEKDLGVVATRFAAFQKRFPESKYSDKATYSAVLIYNQADELDHAIEMAELMKKKYDKSTLAKDNDWLLAEFYERIADFETSAKLFNDYYEAYKKDAKDKESKAADALFNSGLYYQGLGNTKEAMTKFTTYTKEFKDKSDAPDVYWRICELNEVEADFKKSSECFDKFGKEYPKASKAKVFESRYRFAKAQEKLKNKPAAMKEYKWLVAEYPKLPKADQEAEGARLAGAHAAFELLEPEYADYAKMKVTLQRKSLTDKALKADQLACVDSGEAKCKQQGKFLSILLYGNGDYGICALTRMGQVYRDMANSIRNAPLPRNLDEDQIEIYKAELDSVALGPEEKAIEAFENSLNKAYELNIYNDCTLTAQSNLKELNPNKFPDLQKRDFMGAEGFIVSDIRGAPAAKPAAPAAVEPAKEDKKGDKPAADESEEEESGDEGEDEDEGASLPARTSDVKGAVN